MNSFIVAALVALTLGPVNQLGNVVAPGAYRGTGAATNLNTDPLGNLLLSQPASYTNRIQRTTGYGTYSATAGDFNNDGNQDFLAVNFSGSSVTLFLGSVDGLFPATGITVPTITGPRFVATGDFNNDGCLDFAASNRSTTIGVYLGNCHGRFTAGTALTAPQTVQAIGAAQILGNDNWSIVATQRGGTGVYAFVGAGNGTFAAAASYVGPNNCAQLVLTDLNTDGYVDIVCGGNSDNTVGILFGTGAKTFSAVQSIGLSGHSPSSIAVADFNGDGVPDVVVITASTSTPSGVEVLIGNASNNGGNYYGLNASLVFSVDNNNTYDAAQGVVVGDFSGDGFTDIAVAVWDSAGYQADGVAILAGDGRGNFLNTGLISLTVPGQPVNPMYPLAVDLNKDGHPDIIIPSYYGSTTSPGAFVLFSSAITQVTPALGSSFNVVGNVTQTHVNSFSCNVNGAIATAQCQGVPFYYQSLYVESVTISNSSVASNLSLMAGSAANCAGGTTVAGVFYEPVSGTSTLSFIPPMKLPAGNGLCCATSGVTAFTCTAQGYAQ